jgi:hypothetical protein
MIVNSMISIGFRDSIGEREREEMREGQRVVNVSVCWDCRGGDPMFCL